MRRINGDNFTVVHNRQAVAQQLSLVHIMRCQHDGNTLIADLFDQIPEIAASLRIQPSGRLVEEQHRRIVNQRRRDGEALLLPARELLDVAFGFVGQLHLG